MAGTKRARLSSVEFDITPERYNELTWFALRYSELKTHKPKQAAMIEQAAKTAEPVLWPYILRNVTQGAPYHSLLIPCGRNLFYTIRRRFFAELDKLRG